MCRDHLLSIIIGRGEDFWGEGSCYMEVLHGFRGERKGDQPLPKEHKEGDYLELIYLELAM